MREATPPAHPSEIPHAGLGLCCANARSKLSLGLFYLGTNPLDFPAWPCQWPKGSFHQPAQRASPQRPGHCSHHRAPKISPLRAKANSTCRTPRPPGHSHSPGPCPGGTCCPAHAGSWISGKRTGMCVVSVESPCSPPKSAFQEGMRPAMWSIPPRHHKRVFCHQQGKFSFVFSVAVSVFPCGGGCPHACARCADSLTH